jgi:hypothetical protein
MGGGRGSRMFSRSGSRCFRNEVKTSGSSDGFIGKSSLSKTQHTKCREENLTYLCIRVSSPSKIFHSTLPRPRFLTTSRTLFSSSSSSNAQSFAIHTPPTMLENVSSVSSPSTTSSGLPTRMTRSLPRHWRPCLRSHNPSTRNLARCGPHRQNLPMRERASGYGEIPEPEKPETSICEGEKMYSGKMWVYRVWVFKAWMIGLSARRRSRRRR